MIDDLSKPITSLGESDSANHGGRAGGADLTPHGGLSSVAGERDPALWHKTIPALLAETVQRFGDREAAVFAAQGIRWTYRQLAAQADNLAAGLLATGLKPGERVGIWSPNRAERVVMQYASARIGLVLVHVNPAYRLAELEYALGKVGCRAILLAARFKSSDYIDMIRALLPELAAAEAGRLHSENLPDLATVIRMGEEKTPGMFNYDEVMGLGGPAWLRQLDQISAALQPDDAFNIQFTGGTAGRPKGAT